MSSACCFADANAMMNDASSLSALCSRMRYENRREEGGSCWMECEFNVRVRVCVCVLYFIILSSAGRRVQRYINTTKVKGLKDLAL